MQWQRFHTIPLYKLNMFYCIQLSRLIVIGKLFYIIIKLFTGRSVLYKRYIAFINVQFSFYYLAIFSHLSIVCIVLSGSLESLICSLYCSITWFIYIVLHWNIQLAMLVWLGVCGSISLFQIYCIIMYINVHFRFYHPAIFNFIYVLYCFTWLTPSHSSVICIVLSCVSFSIVLHWNILLRRLVWCGWFRFHCLFSHKCISLVMCYLADMNGL